MFLIVSVLLPMLALFKPRHGRQSNLRWDYSLLCFSWLVFFFPCWLYLNLDFEIHLQIRLIALYAMRVGKSSAYEGSCADAFRVLQTSPYDNLGLAFTDHARPHCEARRRRGNPAAGTPSAAPPGLLRRARNDRSRGLAMTIDAATPLPIVIASVAWQSHCGAGVPAELTVQPAGIAGYVRDRATRTCFANPRSVAVRIGNK